MGLILVTPLVQPTLVMRSALHQLTISLLLLPQCYCPVNYVDVPTLMHYAQVSHIWIININLMHTGQFLTHDS